MYSIPSSDNNNNGSRLSTIDTVSKYFRKLFFYSCLSTGASVLLHMFTLGGQAGDQMRRALGAVAELVIE